MPDVIRADDFRARLFEGFVVEARQFPGPALDRHAKPELKQLLDRLRRRSGPGFPELSSLLVSQFA